MVSVHYGQFSLFSTNTIYFILGANLTVDVKSRLKGFRQLMVGSLPPIPLPLPHRVLLLISGGHPWISEEDPVYQQAQPG